MAAPGFDIEQIQQKFDLLKEKLDIVKLKKEVDSLQKESQRGDLWHDEETAKKVLKQLSDIQGLLSDLSSIEHDLKTIQELKQLIQETSDHSLDSDLNKLTHSVTKEIKKLETRTFLSGPYDQEAAVFSIHSGQGGTEAMDWAAMLSRMYTRLWEDQGWPFEQVDYSPGDEAGLKSVTYIIKQPFAYGYLQHERGAHRLVRLSPFNADSLRQTSFANVEVMPLIEDQSDVDIKPEDIEFEAFKSSGAGGQNVNKVSTAVRLRHIPTGIVVSSQSQRQQEQNRKIAMQLLKAKLWEIEERKRREQLAQIKGDHKLASWGNQIRSYILQPYKLVKDLRTDYESTNPDSVLDGDLMPFIEAELRHFASN